jgi:hypothetical protein
VAQALLSQARELWDYFLYYLSVRSDQTRLRINEFIANAIFTAVCAITGIGLMICAAWFVLLGMAGGFTRLFDSAWLGNLTAGLLMLAVIAGGVLLVFQKQRGDFLKRTRLKHEQQRVEQHEKFGRDVASRD